MTIETKLKRATLEIALRHLLKGSRDDPVRTARNMIEACMSVTGVSLSEERVRSLQAALLPKLAAQPISDLLSWLGDFFFPI